MSKQSEARKAQGYNDKPPKKICSECRFFASDFVNQTSGYHTWTDEIKKRCSIGEFSVKKTASCDRFTAISELAKGAKA